jgi:sugar phosphate isomerase/epimerase
MTPQPHRTWAWTLHAHVLGTDHDAILAACQAADVHYVEIHPFHVAGLNPRELEALERRYAEDGVHIDSFHLPFASEDDLTAFYETDRRHAVARTRYWLERLPLLKVRVAIAHPGTRRYSVDIEGLDPFLQPLGRSLEELLPVAESNGIQIALENMPPGSEGGRLTSRPEHLERLAMEFDHTHLGFCLDTGHALLAGGPEHAGDFFEAMAPRLSAFHLADNAGDRDSHLAPGHGLVDWNQFFRQAARLDYPHGMCIEAPPFAPGPNYTLEAWRQLFTELDQRVQGALKGNEA